jgi:hypothetical protein
MNVFIAKRPMKLTRDIILYKKVKKVDYLDRIGNDKYVILELYVPKGAWIYSPSPTDNWYNERKVRVSEALVLNARNIKGDLIKDLVFLSSWTNEFCYTVNEIAIEPDFAKISKRCDKGIHGFFEELDAVKYNINI